MSNKNCPICEMENKCMSGSGEHGNCWCDREEFPREIFEIVPDESIRKHCICQSCLRKFKENAVEANKI